MLNMWLEISSYWKTSLHPYYTFIALVLYHWRLKNVIQYSLNWPLFHCSSMVQVWDILHIYTACFVSSSFNEKRMLHIHSPCFVSLWFKEQDTDTLYSTKNNFVSLCTITCKNSGDMSTQHFGQLNFSIRWHNCRWLDQFQCTFH